MLFVGQKNENTTSLKLSISLLLFSVTRSMAKHFRSQIIKDCFVAVRRDLQVECRLTLLNSPAPAPIAGRRSTVACDRYERIENENIGVPDQMLVDLPPVEEIVGNAAEQELLPTVAKDDPEQDECDSPSSGDYFEYLSDYDDEQSHNGDGANEMNNGNDNDDGNDDDDGNDGNGEGNGDRDAEIENPDNIGLSIRPIPNLLPIAAVPPAQIPLTEFVRNQMMRLNDRFNISGLVAEAENYIPIPNVLSIGQRAVPPVRIPLAEFIQNHINRYEESKNKRSNH